LNDAFQGLKNTPQWILWKELPPLKGKTKRRKVPYDVLDVLNPERHDPHDASIHMTYKTACNYLSLLGNKKFSLGFVLTTHDNFFCIDLDKCITADGPNEHAQAVLSHFPGACVELSHSLAGLHIWGACGPLPDRKKRCNALELYTDNRFIAFTGQSYGAQVHSCSIDWTPSVLRVVDHYLQKTNNHLGTAIQDLEWTETGTPGSLSDQDKIIEVLMRMGTMQAVMHNNPISGVRPYKYKVTPRELWVGDCDALGRAFPSDTGQEYNASAADQALANHVIFLTGGNCELTQTIMLQSALCRDKWLDRDDYLPNTIKSALSVATEFYSNKKPTADIMPNQTVTLPPPPPPLRAPDPVHENKPVPPPDTLVGQTLLPISAMIEYFKGCMYIADRHRVLMPNGMQVKPEVFKTLCGGHVFALAEGKTTTDAFKAFSENQLHQFPRVDTTCFKPTLESLGVSRQDNLLAVNTYVPLFGKQTPGDITPFLKHAEMLLPVESDRIIFLDFLKWCVQNPGKKAQWAPVMQGVQGNGKTVFYTILEYAIGAKYCHQVNPLDLGNVFTGWLPEKIICCIEEIHTQGKRKIADALKPLITNRRAPIQSKGFDQETGDNCANFLLFSNHKDAVLKTIDDRRYCVFYTAQQTTDDLVLMGLDEDYFNYLFSWLENGGLANVAHWLATEPITSTNMLGRSPYTSSTDEAVRCSVGYIEQIIQQAIINEVPGFQEGLLLPGQVNDYIKDDAGVKGFRPQQLRAKLANIGYTAHPAHNVVGPDGKPGCARVGVLKWKHQKFYVLRSSPHWAIESAFQLREVWCGRYLRAQEKLIGQAAKSDTELYKEQKYEV
jgi:hypothetical protein